MYPHKKKKKIADTKISGYVWTGPNREIRIRLNLVKHLRIKISERSVTQRFDEYMSSFSSEERIKLIT